MDSEKKLDPKKALKHEQKGDKLFGKKKYREALGEYQKSEDLNPDRPEIYEKLISAHGQFEHEWQEDDFANSMSWTMRHQELTSPQIRRLHQMFTTEYQEIQKLVQSLMLATEKDLEDKLVSQILDYGEKSSLPVLNFLISMKQLARNDLDNPDFPAGDNPGLTPLMKILALTGGIASGKSTVAAMFRDLGAIVIDADRAAHEAYRQGTSLYREIVGRYGEKILNPTREIDRSQIAARLFGSEREKRWLEERIHPAVRKHIGKLLQQAISKHPPLILVEAALHVETGYYLSFEGLILVKSGSREQIRRLMQRSGLTLEQARQRMNHQFSFREKRRHADWVIDNSGNLGQTRRQVESLFRILSSGRS